MTPAEQREFDELRAQHDRLVKILTDVGDYAGVDLINSVSRTEPMGELVPFPAGGRGGASQRVAGSAVRRAAPRHASTPGVAS